MRKTALRKLLLLVAGVGLSLAVMPSASADHKPHVTKVKSKKTDKTDTSQSAEPDKVLYERAMADMKHSKYTEARLDLQTLINTYPDSEYLAKAKLATADSFYKEGGTSNLTQAVDEYKNFIVFFPFLDEAAYAQMQVAMSHYKMMEKADRDEGQAEAAEDEFRTFLLKYPQSPLVPQAEQYLRNVQEVIADGEYRIAHFYYLKQDYRASAARLVELTGRYPLYSQSDVALYMLGNVYVKAKEAVKNEDDKNHWADLAGQCYSRIVKDYPLSRLAPEAKVHLTSMGMPVPKADPDAQLRMQKQQLYEKQHHPNRIAAMPMGMIRPNPDVHLAAQVGQPNLNPPDDTISPTEVLNQGAAGPHFNIAASISESTGGSQQGSDTESVESSSDTATPAAGTGSDVPTANAGAQAGASIASSAEGAAQPARAAPSTMTSLPLAPSNGGSAASEQAATTENSPPPADTNANSLAPTTSADPPAQASQAVSSPASSNHSNSSTAQSSSPSANGKDDSKNESSSKKKKGLHRIIP